MIPETQLENFDFADFEIDSSISKRLYSNIYCLRSRNNNSIDQQRTSFESDQPLIETPTESRTLQINQEKFCVVFVCKNDSDWTSMNQLINAHGFLYPTRRQSEQKSDNLLNAGTEYLKEHFNFNLRKNSTTNGKLEYNTVRNSDLPDYLTDWKEVNVTKELKKIFPEINDPKGVGRKNSVRFYIRFISYCYL